MPAVIDGYDVPMVKAGQDFGFSDIFLDVFLASNARGVRNLNGNETIENFVAAEKNSPETTVAQNALNTISADYFRYGSRCCLCGRGADGSQSGSRLVIIGQQKILGANDGGLLSFSVTVFFVMTLFAIAL
jgi:hypothetical protein